MNRLWNSASGRRPCIDTNRFQTDEFQGGNADVAVAMKQTSKSWRLPRPMRKPWPPMGEQRSNELAVGVDVSAGRLQQPLFVQVTWTVSPCSRQCRAGSIRIRGARRAVTFHRSQTTIGRARPEARC